MLTFVDMLQQCGKFSPRLFCICLKVADFLRPFGGFAPVLWRTISFFTYYFFQFDGCAPVLRYYVFVGAPFFVGGRPSLK